MKVITVALKEAILFTLNRAENNIMDDKTKRSLGGMLALWAFWIFCAWFIWGLLNDIWLPGPPSSVAKGTRGAASAEGFTSFSSVLVLGLVGVILGAIAWYTRPRDPDA